MAVQITLRDVLQGGAELTVDEHGRPVHALVEVDLDAVDWADQALLDEVLSRLGRRAPVVVGIASETLPPASEDVLTALTLTLSPGGPGRHWVTGGSDELDRIRATVTQAPCAAVALAGLLAVTARSSVPDGLVAESLAYSMLLAASEYATWRARTPRGEPVSRDRPVCIARDGDVLSLVLDRPQRHNAFGRALRDALIEGLTLAELDASITEVVLAGRGPSFCSGGDLDEFGTAPDVAAAHLVRLQQSAGYAIHRIRDRVRAHVHGACIGAGVEVPAFAGRVEAEAGTWFQLPELSMGLVPGAGGTVSVTRRIGPARTAFMALTGARIDVSTALEWGLVDARV